ncbi:acyl-CoA dehydrogenase [Streptomyces sp. H10-C2]|uniref:acyl-CoA dehydrogenase n=1 Tax=unclassified Streptomyces TaxID=2593676 RepID=UPI0024BAF06F|nr:MULTISPECIES: acyl-CoA dehydrogenase [unclassified Streptomyces]MDJ0346583.1 acyl-CoA dehydrogenase [Streptomyces sp. PH10-H1]MDJ0374203.1 acyl-CoA dehydrogenase [Streptomyces sp. H10-C2]
MGIGITEEHQELATATTGWANRAAPPEVVRAALEEGPGARRPAWWGEAAAQGLLAVHLPEEFGGGGGDLLDLAVVLEELGAACLPGPFLPTVLAGAVLARAAEGKALLAGLADGSRVAAVALGAGSMTAEPSESGGYVLDGTAPPVLGGAQADLVLLRAGSVWMAVDAAALEVRECSGADPTRRTAEVVARRVPVPAERVLGIESGVVEDLARVLFAAEACGIAGWALRTATGYAKVREQFGRPIGQFQAVKHLCADMLVRVEQARALTWDAARDVLPLTAAMAAATAVEAAFGCAKDCIQILGGIGFTWEHDAHLYLRRATAVRQLLGAGHTHRLRVAALAGAGARRELRLDLPPEAVAYRELARAAVGSAGGLDPAAARKALAPTGYAAPHLPVPYGLGAGPVQQLAVQQELRSAGVKVSDLGIATWVVPSLIAHGSQEQRDRYVPRTLRGEALWCQLFSEPGAGSDLASLRTRADRLPDGRWQVNGQKVWTSAAQWSDFGILLARTDPAAPKHKGLTYFVVDMKNTPGIGIRPLKEITGDSLFNEVYFDDVVLPADAVVGEVDGGWRVARNTLGNERVHMADQVAFDTGLEALIGPACAAGEVVGDRLGGLLAEAHALASIGLRTTLQQVSGLEPGAGASVRKLVQTPHQQRIAELALELLGPEGVTDERALHGFLMARCLTIAGGTTQVQLNVVAERILGLPRD